MIGLSFVAMYALMYAMVDSIANVYVNMNQLYMVATMIATMIVFEILLMSSMYGNKRLNTIIIVASLVVLVGSYIGIRRQTVILDRQFLRSMIPHHAGAILMCEQASLEDSEIRTLCKNIQTSQQAEITQMKAILERLK